MKKLALIAALSVVGIANAQAADGTITINGLVTDKTCDIVTPAGKDFTVTLPTVSKQTLAVAGDVAGRTPFQIKFEPYRVCRRVNILRDYPDDKIKIYP
ncbi:P pilus assembly protein, pilin FimA [Acinetobacter baumannii]|nr:P pilus assembly protein, pilin FimA [Acinetobacter baumannii]